MKFYLQIVVHLMVFHHFLVIGSDAAQQSFEFGREIEFRTETPSRKRRLISITDSHNDSGDHNQQGFLADQLRHLEDFDDIFQTRFLLSLSMSMTPVSSPPDSTPTAAPVSVSSPPDTTPTDVPVSVPLLTDPTPTVSPTVLTSGATLVPSILTGTFEPSAELPPASPSIDGQPNTTFPNLAFDCVGNDGTISLGEATDTDTTGIYLFLGYKVESASDSTDDYMDELEHQLLLTAVSAALGCSSYQDNQQGSRSLSEYTRNLVSMESIIVDSSPCEPTVVNAKSCNNIETDLVFFLKGQVDPDRAAYSGYAAIEAEMTNDGYIGIVSTVEKIVYLSPLPLPVPPQPDEVGTTDTTILISQDEDELVVSPWTIGACVASVFGGVISLLVWRTNRQSRHHRHVQLLEDESVVESSARNPVSV